MKYRTGSGSRGFTLVNVLAVIGILVILAALLCQGFSLARSAAEEVEVVHRATHIGFALDLYYTDHRRYPDAYPAQLDSRLAPYLEEDLKAYVQDPAGLDTPARPGEGAEPLNESYVSPPTRNDPNRYVLTIDPRRQTARSAVLFANHTVQLVKRLPVRYGDRVLKPGDVVSGGTLTFATNTTVELSGDTMARAVHSFLVDDRVAFHIVKLPRYRHGYLRADAVKGDTVHIVTDPGVVCVRNGVADVDVVPVPAADGKADPGDDPTEEDYTPEETDTPPGGRLGDYAIFSGSRVMFTGNPTVDHLMGSNGTVEVGQAGVNRGHNSQDMVAGESIVIDGNFSADGNVAVSGDVTVAKNAEVKGNVDSGGHVAVRGTVWGAVTASGAVTVDQGTAKGRVASGGSVELGQQSRGLQDVVAGGDLAVEKQARIYGSATYGGQLTNQGAIDGGATQTGGVTASPQPPPLPLALPPRTEFTIGAQDLTLHGSETLAPGAYNDVTLSGGTVLSLSPGKYTFRSISTEGNTQIKYKIDNDAEGVELFIQNDINIGGNLQTSVEGSGSAAGVYIETHGNVTVRGTVDLYGTIYAPEGGIDMQGTSAIHGACYARDEVRLTGTCDVHFMPSGRGVGGEPPDDGDDDEDDGGGSGGNDGGNDGTGGGVPQDTRVRVLNHSAEVTVDARVLRRGHDVPYIAPRKGPRAGCVDQRVLGAGSHVRVGDWVTVSRFLAR